MHTFDRMTTFLFPKLLVVGSGGRELCIFGAEDGVVKLGFEFMKNHDTYPVISQSQYIFSY